ncbi:MAG TPA: TonB-dependent receptor plug domain-containing protein, partial [Usitatibacter sp.]|nr:TonB-dependent receptor plug domain-containing protein [Usitatibacter sp.]
MLRLPAALLVALPLLHALAVHAASADEDPEANPAPRESISVTGERERAPDWNYRRQHLLPEVDAASNAITVTKRSSVARLDEQPPVLDNDVRALFARLPGLFVSEQQNPSQWNFSYRGLGNPQESEFVLVLQDGLPIESDWIGFPTIYYTPMPQAIESVQLIRGGASLLYGPQPAPVLNFVSRPTDPRVGMGGGSAENVFGAHRMFSTFETWSGRREGWDFRVNAGERGGEGERSNGGYRVTQGDLHAGYVIDSRRRLDLDLHGYGSTSGDPGRLSLAQYQADRDTTSTPFNRVWVERDTAVLRYEDKPDARSGLAAKLWTGWQDLARRTAAAAVAPQPQPATTVVEDQRFRYTGLDVRWLQRWSRANAFTAGAVLYDSTSPWRQYVSGNLA